MFRSVTRILGEMLKETSGQSHLMKQRRKRKRPAVPTVKGTTAVVVQHAEAFERLLDVAARVDAEEGIRQGLEDAKQGKVRPAREFFEDFEAGHGIPR